MAVLNWEIWLALQFVNASGLKKVLRGGRVLRERETI